MKSYIFSSFQILFATLLHSTTSLAQTQAPSLAPLSSPVPVSPPTLTPPPLTPPPAAPVAPSPAPLSTVPVVPLSPGPPGPTSITAILDKAGTFSAFIRLLKTTQVDDRITSLLTDSKVGLTLFAPTDKAFSELKPGTLNSLSDRQQVQLVLYHILTSYFPVSQFEAASNPLTTQAGDTAFGDYPLNVSTAGNQVKLMTGVVNTAVDKTIYTDGQLAVYQVGDVLLPMRIFAPQPPAPAPAKHKKAAEAPSNSSSSSSSSDSTDDNTTSAEASDSVALTWHSLVWLGGALLAVFSM